MLYNKFNIKQIIGIIMNKIELLQISTSLKSLEPVRKKANLYSDSLKNECCTKGNILIQLINKIYSLLGIRTSNDEVYKGWIKQIIAKHDFSDLNSIQDLTESDVTQLQELVDLIQTVILKDYFSINALQIEETIEPSTPEDDRVSETLGSLAQQILGLLHPSQKLDAFIHHPVETSVQVEEIDDVLSYEEELVDNSDNDTPRSRKVGEGTSKFTLIRLENDSTSTMEDRGY